MSLQQHTSSLAPQQPQFDKPPQPPFFPQKQVKICLVGSTGSGKSALGSFLINPRKEDYYDPDNQVFKTGEYNRSCTSECDIQSFESLSIMDTPGLNENATKDFQHVLHVVKTLESFRQLNVVALVMKFESRMDTQWEQTVTAYQKLMGEEIFNRNLIVVMTGFDPSHPKYKSRLGLDKSLFGSDHTEKIREATAQRVQKLLGLDNPPLVWAIDCMPDPDKVSMIAIHEKTRDSILEYSAEQHPVSVGGMKVPKTKEVQEEDLMCAKKLEGEIEILEADFENRNAVPQAVQERLQMLRRRHDESLGEIEKLKSTIASLDTSEEVIASRYVGSSSSFVLFDDGIPFELDAPGPITRITQWSSKGTKFTWTVGGEGAPYARGYLKKSGWVGNISLDVKIYCESSDVHAPKLEKLRKLCEEKENNVDYLDAQIKKELMSYPDLEKPLEKLRQHIKEKHNEVEHFKDTHLTILEAEERLDLMKAKAEQPLDHVKVMSKL